MATPTEADSVKLLTVHRAKGLEWDAVFLVGVCDDKFPTGTVRTKWTAGPAVLPTPLRGDAGDLPAAAGCTTADLDAATATRAGPTELEELRLGLRRAHPGRHLLVVSSYCWSPTGQTPLGPSPYQLTSATRWRAGVQEPERGTTSREKGDAQPARRASAARPGR